MELTSGTFVWGMIVAAVLAFAVLVVFWARLGGRQWWWYPVRALALGLTLTLTLLGSGAYLNQKYVWYASWADLLDPKLEKQDTALGAPPAQAAATSKPGTWGPAAEVSRHDRTPVERLGPQLTSREGGRWGVFEVEGRRSGHTGKVTVWIPDSYFAPENERRAYPVLEFMHGIPGNPRGIVVDFRIGTSITEVARRGEISEPIVIIPDLTPRGIDTECVDSKDLRMETWLSVDVPAWTAAHLRVRQDRASWALEGFSAGAYCASALGIHHPQTYSAAIAMAGYFRPNFDKKYQPFGPGSPEWDRYDLIAQVKKKAPALALWVQSSRADGTTWPNIQEFLGTVRSPMAVESVVLTSAGHRWTIWRDLTPDALTWLGKTAPGFAPVKR